MINRDKLEHILEYARQQRHIGQCCKVPPEDMVEIMERLLNSGNSLVIPDEMTSEQAYEIGYYYGDPVDVFARGANWMRQHIIDSTLAAAPQSPGSEPATVPGKWIPVSERMPEAEGHYLVWANASRIDGYCDHLAIATYQGGEWSNEFNWLVTHWMPLPAAPQEPKP
ncbi:TPA: DUF551 domain-containing protein [Klebsiella pneumoniae]|nr:DUF551 domain-containing protein [Klebsiella pneumoniae]HBR1148660.1 DUF551 domain-containing protein [Klebsiella pneumoniae]HBR1186488.1 DUF551 domain-containing protein [Klebsiella pneumoniae]HBR1330126.1 DUF551 domain-containing protein [Klebsiella pneumoniae]HBR1335510.1 DUF551 domain-containing protein [Klebsiella pneumoniae]